MAIDRGLEQKVREVRPEGVTVISSFEPGAARLLVREYCARRHDIHLNDMDAEDWEQFSRTMKRWADDYAKGHPVGYFRPRQLAFWERDARFGDWS
jgi:hypothetical protein